MQKDKLTSAWAIGLSSSVIFLSLAAASLLGIAYAINGEPGISDNWVGMTVVVVLFAGLILSLVAFILAFMARRSERKSRWLFLPFLTFPILIAFVALGEIFWWQ